MSFNRYENERMLATVVRRAAEREQERREREPGNELQGAEATAQCADWRDTRRRGARTAAVSQRAHRRAATRRAAAGFRRRRPCAARGRRDAPPDAPNRIADERQVADHVQNLVPDELVLEAQRIEDAGLTEHDGVLERTAQRQPALTQHFHFLQEAERARRRNLVDEHLLVESSVFC